MRWGVVWCGLEGGRESSTETAADTDKELTNWKAIMLGVLQHAVNVPNAHHGPHADGLGRHDVQHRQIMKLLLLHGGLVFVEEMQVSVVNVDIVQAVVEYVAG